MISHIAERALGSSKTNIYISNNTVEAPYKKTSLYKHEGNAQNYTEKLNVGVSYIRADHP